MINGGKKEAVKISARFKIVFIDYVDDVVSIFIEALADTH